MFFRAVILLAIVLSTAVVAREVKVNSTTINLVTAKDFCELDDGNAADQGFLTAARGMDGDNHVLAVLADCQQLQAWRGSSTVLMKDTIYFKASKSFAKPAGQSAESFIKAVCAEMRANADKWLDEGAPDLRSRAEIFMKNVEITGNQFLGTVEEAPGVCYGAILKKQKAATGERIAVLGMFAISLVGSQPVYLVRNSRYVDSGSLKPALDNLKSLHADFAAANRGDK